MVVDLMRFLKQVRKEIGEAVISVLAMGPV